LDFYYDHEVPDVIDPAGDQTHCFMEPATSIEKILGCRKAIQVFYCSNINIFS